MNNLLTRLKDRDEADIEDDTATVQKLSESPTKTTLKNRQKDDQEELKWDLLGRSGKKPDKPDSDFDCSDNSDDSVGTIPACS